MELFFNVSYLFFSFSSSTRWAKPILTGFEPIVEPGAVYPESVRTIWTDSWTRDSEPWFSIFLTELVQPDKPNQFESVRTILTGFELIVEPGIVNINVFCKEWMNGVNGVQSSLFSHFKLSYFKICLLFDYLINCCIGPFFYFRTWSRVAPPPLCL